MKIQISKKQYDFINATATEVLFGGAAGGGKSYGQVIDALLYAMKYAGSKQVIFRRTFKELEKSIIRTVLSVYPKEMCRYNHSSHVINFINGSIIDFAYCDSENDVYNYQSAEFDVIRFDELTHFDEHMYIYMLSRLRGTNGYPKSVKSSTNPGGRGHSWVKDRFINIGPPGQLHKFKSGSRIFIPSFVQDNDFLMASDPDYVNRLYALSEVEKKQLLYGDWDCAEGRFFTEFDRSRHVIEPFEIPSDWRVYRSFDYGLDMLAVLWIAVDSMRNIYVFREFNQKDMTISAAANKINELSCEKAYVTYAPPDLWGRSQESGKARSDLFIENNLYITKSSNNRQAGWACIKEMLKPDINGIIKLHIFANCTTLIKNLSEIQIDKRNPNDCDTQPHEITHSPDALRYFCINHIVAAKPVLKPVSPVEYDLERKLRKSKKRR